MPMTCAPATAPAVETIRELETASPGSPLASPLGSGGLDPAEQATTGLAALARLATITLPAHPVRWVPHWDERAAVAVSGPAQLAACMAMLGRDEYGGVTLSGSTGPWAQVRKAADGEDFLLELHPREHTDPGLPILFERIVDLAPADSAELAWSWVRGQALPAGLEHEVELRTVPAGSSYDEPL